MRLGAVASVAVARLAAMAAPLAALASRAFAGIAGAAASLARRLSVRAAAVALIALGAMAIASLVLILALGALKKNGPTAPDRTIASGELDPATVSGKVGSARGGARDRGYFPSDPREIAGMLVIPGIGDWPYPLALIPKPRYTEADADGLWPDFGSMDLTEITRRRKAELEAILDAVD